MRVVLGPDDALVDITSFVGRLLGGTTCVKVHTRCIYHVYFQMKSQLFFNLTFYR